MFSPLYRIEDPLFTTKPNVNDRLLCLSNQLNMDTIMMSLV